MDMIRSASLVVSSTGSLFSFLIAFHTSASRSYFNAFMYSSYLGDPGCGIRLFFSSSSLLMSASSLDTATGEVATRDSLGALSAVAVDTGTGAEEELAEERTGVEAAGVGVANTTDPPLVTSGPA
jgi:hypothetical protein